MYDGVDKDKDKANKKNEDDNNDKNKKNDKENYRDKNRDEDKDEDEDDRNLSSSIGSFRAKERSILSRLEMITFTSYGSSVVLGSLANFFFQAAASFHF